MDDAKTPGKSIFVPIVVIDNGDLTIHRTVESAEGWIEPQDTKSIEVFDSRGNPLEATIELVEVERSFLVFKWKSRGIGVKISRNKREINPEEKKNIRGKMKSKIINWLAKYKGFDKEDLIKLDFDQLIVELEREGT